MAVHDQPSQFGPKTFRQPLDCLFSVKVSAVAPADLQPPLNDLTIDFQDVLAPPRGIYRRARRPISRSPQDVSIEALIELPQVIEAYFRRPLLAQPRRHFTPAQVAQDPVADPAPRRSPHLLLDRH